MTSPSSTRVILSHAPYVGADRPWSQQGKWPAHWISLPEAPVTPNVVAYRLTFHCDQAETIRVHTTGDERYVLFLDGERVGLGPERGDESHWAFESYDLNLAPGEHRLVARVQALGEGRPFAQHSVRPGFFLCPDDESRAPDLATGSAPWEAKVLGGYRFKGPQAAWGTGLNVVIHGQAFDWGFERGQGDGWTAVQADFPGVTEGYGSDLPPIHLLRPARLPAQRQELWPTVKVRHAALVDSDHTSPIALTPESRDARLEKTWDSLLNQTGPVLVPPHTRQRIILDFDNYVCGHPLLVTSGGTGSRVRIHWQESLFVHARETAKGNRDEVDNKYFTTIWTWEDGIGDTFFPGGGRGEAYESLWWHAGRYVEVFVETGADALAIESLAFRETRYPLEDEAAFQSSDPRLAAIIPLAVRALQECSHETYMDCPYYEQLQYVGDTRLQCLVTYAISPDDRLPRQAILAFDQSRRSEGITQSRYPSRVRQIIPPFSLWWVAMVHDYAQWRDDRAFVADRMPGVRAVLDHYRQHIGTDGLLLPVPGWNYVDWVPTWANGQPPTSQTNPTAPTHFHIIYTLRLAAELEEWLGEPELATRNRRTADHLAQAALAFWVRDRALYADDLAHQHFSQHSQILAFLAGVKEDLPSLDEPDQVKTTIYFRHYLFEAMNRTRNAEGLLNRLELWHSLVTGGLRTTIEMPEPTRSDCHAWGAHPYFHFLATILGIRPADFGFASVRIAPNLGPLTEASGTLVHPAGPIRVAFSRTGSGLHGEIELPEGLTGSLDWHGHRHPLVGGRQSLEIQP